MIYEQSINALIADYILLFDAVQHAANIAENNVGCGHPYTVLPRITVTSDLLTKGPARIYDDQYREQAEKEYGEPMDLTGLSDHEALLRCLAAYHRISVEVDDTLVCCIEGREGMRMTKCVDGEWQGLLKELYMSSEEYQSLFGQYSEP